MDEQYRREETGRTEVVLPMLAGFVQAGVHVDVTCR